MSAALFIMPLKKGKTATYKAFLRECMGPRRKDYEDLLLRYGLNDISIWVSTIDGRDYAVFTHEMNDNAAKLLESWSTSSHSFDQWFDKHLRDCYEVADVTKTSIKTDFLGKFDARKND
jgi:hypothetical protein